MTATNVTTHHLPSRSGRRSAADGAVRLTRRGRLVVTLTILAALAAAAVVFAARAMATVEDGRAGATRTVVVERGDTLWEIAAEVAAPGKVRETVHRIEELNALQGPALVEGQEIAVPLR